MTTRNFIMRYLSDVEGILRQIEPGALEEIIDVIYGAYTEDRQIFIMGNGGGAATAMHFTCDLNKTAIVPGRRRMRAVSLSDNTALVTAWANDTHYTNIFGEQLVNFARPGDLVIGLTASGMSVNIVNAIALANELGCETIAFVGFDGGTVGAIAKHVLHISSTSYQHIEDVHLLLCHVITNALQERARTDDVLDTTGLGDELQERIRRIYYAKEQLRAEPSLERRMRMIPDQVRRTIGFHRAVLFIADDAKLRMVAAHGVTEIEGAELDIEADLVECEAFREHRAIVVPAANGRTASWLPGYQGITSCVVAPIVHDDRSFGLIVGGYANGTRAADARDVQLLQIFAMNIRSALDERAADPLPGAPWPPS